MSRSLPVFVACSCFFALLAAQAARAAELTDETIDVGDTTRRYLVHDYSGESRTALVIVLHGGGGNGENAATQTGFDRVAEREGLIAVYPYGSGLLPNALLTWNAGHCCGYAMRGNVDDVGFVSALIDHLIATRSVDPGRVFVTGLSNGGMMTHRLGIELGDKITAIAPVISSLWGDEPALEAALPVMIVNGAEDGIVRPGGGRLGLEERLGRRAAERAADAPTLPIASQSTFWSRADGCTDHAESTSAAFMLSIDTDCRGGVEVRRYVIAGSGHAWPGGTAPRTAADRPVTSIDLNELIWSFFRRFSREPAAATAAAAAAPAGGAAADTAADSASAAEGMLERGGIEAGGRRREFLLYTPTGLDRFEDPRPLVIVFHGGGGTATQIEREVGASMEAEADRHGFLVLYPNAVDKFWDFGEGVVSNGLAERVDDRAFFEALLDRAPAAWHVDPQRIFATGISRGGQASYFVACEFPRRILGIAPVAMSLPVFLEDDCAGEPPMAIAIFNGTDDPLVPFEGGVISIGRNERDEVLSTDATAALFRDRNACGETSPETESIDPAADRTVVVRTAWTDCAGAPVAVYRIEGGGHTWPSGSQYLPRLLVGAVSRDIDAAKEIWAFFAGVPSRP